MADKTDKAPATAPVPKKFSLRVAKTFVFNLPSGFHKMFHPGVHEVPAEIAEHPWIAAGADGHVVKDEPVEVVKSDEVK